MFEDLDSLKDKIIVPTSKTLSKIDMNELFVKIEFRAVLKIKIVFMKWFQDLVQNTIFQGNLFAHDIPEDSEFRAQASEPDRKKSEPLAIDTKADSPDEGQMMMMIDTTAIKKQESIAGKICMEEDALIDNPQKKLTCILCGLNGERSITGRLIPYQVNQFVHVNCALWTQEVQEGQEENDVCSELYNFHFAYNAFNKNVCVLCGKTGATIFCSNKRTKKCPAAFHFPCAYASRKVAFLQNTDIYCENCTPKVEEAIPGFPIEFRDYPKRRILIVKNTQPQCTNVFAA